MSNTQDIYWDRVSDSLRLYSKLHTPSVEESELAMDLIEAKPLDEHLISQMTTAAMTRTPLRRACVEAVHQDHDNVSVDSEIWAGMEALALNRNRGESDEETDRLYEDLKRKALEELNNEDTLDEEESQD